MIVICTKYDVQNIMRVAMWSVRTSNEPPPRRARVLLAIHGLDQPLLRQVWGAKWGSHAMSKLINMSIMFVMINRLDKQLALCHDSPC